MDDRPSWENRLEYRPPAASRPRSASTGRLQRLSAQYGGGAPLRPTTAHDWAASRDLAPPTQRRVYSAISRASGGAPIGAWTNPGEVLGESSRKVHVQSLARNKRPELLAEDLMSTKEQLTRAREESMMAQVEKRRLEAEVIKLRSSLLKSEELLHNKERMMSPTVGISQLYRSPDTTHLVSNLKEQNRELRVARDSMADELTALSKSTRATRMAEVQSELFAAQQEIERLSKMHQAMNERLDMAEMTAQQAVGEAEAARRTLDEYISIGAPLDPGSIKLTSNSSISGGSVRKTLQAMHQAHKMLINQAVLIRAIFPPGTLSMAAFQDKARQKVSTAGAPDVLNFLRNHVSKLVSELAGQPGEPPAAAPAAAATPLATPMGTPFKAPRTPAGAGAAAGASVTATPEKISNQAQLLEAVSALVRKLRAMEESRFHANPEFESSSEQMADMMQLYVDEVHRLQGKAPTPPPVPPPTQPSPARSMSRQSSVKSVAKVLAPVPAAEAEPAAPFWAPEPPVAAPTPALAPAAETLAAAVAAADAPKPVDPIPYTVFVRTSDVSGGAFDGSVYLVLEGANGSSTEFKIPSDRYSFDTGEENEFEVEAEDVGHLRSLALRMEVAGEDTSGDDTWHLEKVRVKSSKADAGQGVDSTFFLEDWVRPSTKVQLFPLSTKPRAEYEVLVFTADSRGAGTDGKVSIRLVGDAGASAWSDLPTDSSAASTQLSRGASDSFKVLAADVGDISQLVLRLSGDSAHSDWNLARVEVLHQGTGWKSVFYCNDWIKRNSLVVLQEADTWLAMCKYTVEVKTSDLKGADFDGQAFVTLSGYWGTSAELRLARPGRESHAFGRGATEVFEIMADEVGPVTNVTVRVDAGDDVSDAWGLQEINVVRDWAWYGGQFIYGGWLSASVPSTTIWKYRDVADYKVSVFTSAEAGAAFDGDVYLTLTGAYGSTDELLLANDSSVEGPAGVPKTLYNSTAHQEFSVKATNVGNLTQAKIRIAATGTTSSWLLDRVEVLPPAEQATEGAPAPAAVKAASFSLKGWVYPETAAVVPKQLEQVEYKVKVTTSECSDNFDGSVYLTLTGLDGNSEELKLTNTSSGNFFANAVAEFSLKAGDVGQVSSVTLRLDNDASQPYWHLAKVEVTNVASGAVSYFRYNSWMNIYWNSSATLSTQSLFEYTISVVTAEQDPGTFDGDVFVQLQGSYTSDWIKVPCEGTFSSKVPTSVTLKLSDIGTPYRADVKLEAKGRNKSLRLDRIELTNATVSGLASVYPNPGKGSVEAGGISYLYQVNMVTHSLEVVTGTGPTYKGPAFVTLVCENGDTDEAQLLTDEGAPAAFETLQSTNVTLRTYDLGAVKTIKVRCGGAWPLDRIRMYSHTGTWETCTYYSGKQLGSGSTMLKKLDNIDYVVTISTDDVRGNGTDANVFLTLIGEYGASSDIQLWPDNYDRAFDRGTVDKASVTTCDVGQLQSIKVRLSAPGWWTSMHAGLSLGEVTVLQTSNGSLVKFPYHAWIDKPDEAVEIKAGQVEQVFNQYKITVVGTYSTLTEWGYNATIKIKGDSGETRLLKLLSAEAETDEATKACTFSVGAMDVGTLTSIDFGVGNAATSDYMTISRVEVLNTDTKAAGAFLVQQYVYSWNGLSSYTKSPSDTSYCVEVTTASLSDAKGFDGSVYLIIHGDLGSSEETKLENWWSSGFQPGSRNSFYFSSINVGVISGVTVRTENPSAPSSRWGLAVLEVTNTSNSSKAVCEWKKGYIQAGTTTKIPKSKVEVDYEVTIKTGDVSGAGTDGRVEIRIGGSSGCSDWIPLEQALVKSSSEWAPFARNATDSFFLKRAPDIGEDRWINLKLAGESLHSSWYVSTVELLNTSTGIKSTFPSNNWLRPDCETTLSESSAVPTMVPYTVNVKTSNIRGSDFEGEAYIQLQGYDGSTDWIRLMKQGYSKCSFLRDETVSLTLNGTEVGYIYAVQVKIEPNDNDPNWNLEKVTILKRDGSEAEFQCGRWLDAANPCTYLSRWQDSIKYKITAYTSAAAAAAPAAVPAAAGDAPAAAFDGRAFITLQGCWGSNTETELVNDSFSYAPGEAQSFELDGSNVGSLQSLTLRAEPGPSGQAAKWTLDCIEVSRSTEPDTVVAFKNSVVAEDGSRSTVPLTLSTGSDTVTLTKDRNTLQYKITVVTGDAADSAFDGDVYIQVTGNDGSSDEIKLSNAAAAATNFGVSSAADFSLTMPDYGGIRYVYLRAQFTGAATTWNLARFEMAVADGQKTVFNYNSYLNTFNPSTYLYPQTWYTCKLVVKTSDSSDARFKGQVFLSMATDWDKAAEVALVGSEDSFQPGHSQEFTIKTNLSYCSNLTFRIEPMSGGASRWNVESVALSFDSGNQQYACNKDKAWTTADATTTLTPVWMGNYGVNLETSDQSDPFDGSLFLTLLSTDPSKGQESNEVQLTITEPLRAGSKLTLDSVLIASVDFNAARIRAAPREGSGSGTKWLPGILDVSGNLFVFDGPISVPGTGLGKMLSMVEFSFKVHTPEMRGNGTDGALNVVMVGDKVSTPERQLYFGDGQALEPGKQSSASVTLPDVGAFKELKLRLAGSGGLAHSQLYVSKVEVTNVETGMMTAFPINAWIGGSEEAVISTPEGRPEDVYVTYNFDVHTAANASAFDGEVQFKLQGSDGSEDSGCITLGTGTAEGEPGLWRSGACDSVAKRIKDMGAPTKLFSNINGRGNCSSWDLYRVDVTNTKTGDKKSFKLGGSLYTWNWWTEIPEVPQVQYQVTSTMANTGAKDFDGEIFLTFSGEDGAAVEVQLERSGDSFQPSAKDTFYVTTQDVGRMSSVVVRVAPGSSGRASKWALTCLEVTNLSSGMLATFEYDRLIASGTSETIQKNVENVDYQVTFETADVRGAGTDGSVYLTLSGDTGVTPEVLVSSDPENFRRGSSFDFSFNGVEVGGNRKVSVRLAAPAGAELHSGWNLGAVHVLNMRTGMKGRFNYNSWLPMTGGSVQLDEVDCVNALSEYKVDIETMDLNDAAFDGKAWITFEGWGRKTGEIPLALPGRTSASFKPNETASFVLQGVDVGYLSNIIVRMEPNASDPEWCLGSVKVSTANGYSYEFAYGNRLNAENPSATLQQSYSPADFMVSVYTSDAADAGFQGDVFVKAEGLAEYSSWSDPKPLIAGPSDFAGNVYAPASCREFKVSATDIGPITKLHVSTNKPGAKWHLDRIVVKRVGDAEEKEYVFLQRDWLKMEEGGSVAIPRDLPKTEWKVVVVTGAADDSGLPEGGVVSLVIQGTEGSVPMKLVADAAAGVKLANTPVVEGYKAFGHGASDTFLVSAADVGAVRSVVLSFDAPGGAWFVERVEVTNTGSGATSILKHKSSMQPGNESTLWPPSRTNFEVQVHTMDGKGAAFDGDVFITATNSWNTADEVKLDNGSSSNYERGSCSKFNVSVDESYVTSLVVRIEPKAGSAKSALYLERVDLIQEFTTDALCFIHKGVLQAPDQASVTLSRVYMTYWEATLVSAAETEPFNGKVSITLLGDQTNAAEATDKVALDPQPDPDAPAGAPGKFMPGSRVLCKFCVPAPAFDVSAATLDVEFPSGGDSAKGWTLERMELKQTWGSTMVFCVDTKFNTQKTGITVKALEDCAYDIIVTTSDVAGSGTDGAAYVTVTGSSDSTGEQELTSDSAQLFERGNVDVFTINSKELGDIKKLVLRLADPSSGVAHSQWHVASVDVLQKRSGLQTSFAVNAWIQPGGSVVLDKPGATRETYQPYTITVVTDSAEDSAFDADLSLVLRGENGMTSYPLPLTSKAGGGSPFAAGAKAVFRASAAAIGPLSAVSVTLLANKNQSSWRPKEIQVVNEATKDSWVFRNGQTLMFYWDGAQDVPLSTETEAPAPAVEKAVEKPVVVEEPKKEEVVAATPPPPPPPVATPPAATTPVETTPTATPAATTPAGTPGATTPAAPSSVAGDKKAESVKPSPPPSERGEGSVVSSVPPSRPPAPRGVAPSETFTDMDDDAGGESATDMFDSMSIASGLPS